jgi:hypothetical protein
MMTHMTSSGQSALQKIGRWVPAVLLTVVGVVAGWLVAGGVLNLPLSEGVLFALGGVAALAFLGGAVLFRPLMIRAFMVGGFVGTAGSLILVALLVVG